ncbi:aminoacylase-1-like isoform X1 [Ostrinia nubilalis]|uniref:aminoacylase-1-like isoform X1 n=2 Tax=Ostrinia nubilalis TaxID=29057 RepID=UPI003082233A
MESFVNRIYKNMAYKLLLLSFVPFLTSTVMASPLPNKLQEQLENPAVVKFREYLRIDTSPSENLQEAVEFWRRQAADSGLDFAVYSPAGKPICVLTRVGADPTLPSIMLNSHMDVVAAVPIAWTYPPYEAQVDNDGNIYGRGAQDTKDVAIQYLEAVRRIIAQNVTLQRTVHITLMPDEETGGFEGIRPFIKTPEFKALNIGFALDEGLANPTDDLYATYQDRRAWSIQITVKGKSGHGSSMPADIAIKKLQRLINVMMRYRKPLEKALISVPSIRNGFYTTLNLNMINGGMAPNIIPETFTLVADMRLSPEENATEILSLVNSWGAFAGNGTTVDFLRREMESLATPIDETNPYWVTINETITHMGYNLVPVVCPATSDMLHIRNIGIPAIGFAPKRRTTSRAHDIDEYLNIDIFLEGIDIYVSLITNLANLPEKKMDCTE